MSGDVQPRKRKDKKKKKDGADDVQSNFSSEEIMHSHKDVGTGGNMCTKIIFYSLLGALLVMIGIILLDQRGLTDLDSSGGDSQWAPIFQGWLEDPPSHDDDHLKTTDSGEEDHGGNTNGEDLNDSSEDTQDDVKASGEKNDDQVRKMADRSSNINNVAHVVEPHITLQTADDMKVDLNFKKPVEETKTKESIGVSMEKPDNLSKDPTKQTSRPSKSREKPEDHTQKIDDKIVDSIKSSTGDGTTKDKKPESSYKSSTISQKISDKSDTGKASEINIESEKPLRVIDNHKKEQDKIHQNYQKVSESKLPEKKVVNNAEKQPSDKLNIVSEKPSRNSDTRQKEQDPKQQNYQKVSEETKTASSSSEKKVTETKPVNKAEKQPSDQKIKDDSDTNSVPKKPVSNERETPGSKTEKDSRIGVSDKSTTEHQKEKQPSDQKKKDDSKTNDVPKKPVSNEREIPSSSTEKDSKIGVSDKSTTEQKKKEQPSDQTKKQDSNTNSVPQKSISNEKEMPSSKKEKGSRIGASDKSTTEHKKEKQPTDETKKHDSNTNSIPQKPVSNENEMPSNKKEKDSRIGASDKSTVEHQTDLKSNQKPSLDKTNAGDFSKNHKPVVQPSPEINTKKEGKLTDLKHNIQTQKVSSELNMENTVKQNSGKVSEQQHNDKLNKEKNEELNNVIDKSSGYKKDDSQQGKVPSGSDKTVETEKVKKNVASQAPDKSHQTTKSKLEPDENEDKDEDGDSGIEADETDTIGDQQNSSDEEDTDERPAPTLSKFSKGPGGEKAQNYVNYDITNDDDWNLIDELDKAAAEKPEVAILKFDLILKSHPNSPRAWYGKATALDRLAEMQQSNHILEQAIEAFKKVVALGPAVKDKLLLQAAQRCIERMRFKGQHLSAVAVHQALISRFPNNSQFQNQLAVTYLMINRIPEAKRVLEKVLQNWKNDGFAQVHYGFILKTSGNNLEEAVKYLHNGIATREPGTIDGRFFFQLGDALHRLGRKDEAMEVYEMGVQEKLFLSKYQRSLYNVDRLRAQPWWTPEQTTYVTLFNTLKNKWMEIRHEGLAALYEKDINLFQDESENLKDSGKWQQLELYARGRKIQKNCLKAPLTCQLIDAFPMARDCKRGQVKFSVMHAGTHVWPHCGPTNCRLRSHLGLVVPSGTFIRVADETRSWKEGDFIIFDDSFEHEVWHNGTSTRLVLIVDVWHPELTEEEKRTMAAI